MKMEENIMLRKYPDSNSNSFESDITIPDSDDFGIKTPHKSVQSSNLQASFTLFKSFIGTGILALPYAYKIAGVGLAIIVTIFISFMLTHCFLLLLKTAEDKAGKERTSFQKLGLEILGLKGKYLVQTLLIIEQLGCCVGVLIFTKDFLNHVLCSFGIDSLCNNTIFNLFFALSLVVPLSLINNMHYFYIPSLAANFFIILGLLAQMFFNSQVAEDLEIRSSFGKGLGQFHFSSLHLFFGVAMFSYEGVGVTFSIRDSMEKPHDLPKLLKKQMIILTTIYIIFSATSCLVLGDRLEDIVFFSLPTNDSFYLMIQILYAASALCTYPIQLFPAVRIIEESAALKTKLFTEAGNNRNKKLRYGVRFCVIGVVFFVAYSASSFHVFLNLLGSCVFTLLGFGLPIWLYLTQFKGRLNIKERMLNYGILGVTGMFGAIGFMTSLWGLFPFNAEDVATAV